MLWECCGWGKECKSGKKGVKTHVINMKSKDKDEDDVDA